MHHQNIIDVDIYHSTTNWLAAIHIYIWELDEFNVLNQKCMDLNLKQYPNAVKNGMRSYINRCNERRHKTFQLKKINAVLMKWWKLPFCHPHCFPVSQWTRKESESQNEKI